MSHSFTKIWIHSIWSTKNREPLITPNVEITIHNNVRDEFAKSACHIEIVNGMPEHVHSLFLLNPKKRIIEVLQQVKGGSSHTITHNNLIAGKFSWQTGYAAFFSQ